jgi:hypothetical protein
MSSEKKSRRPDWSWKWVGRVNRGRTGAMRLFSEWSSSNVPRVLETKTNHRVEPSLNRWFCHFVILSRSTECRDDVGGVYFSAASLLSNHSFGHLKTGHRIFSACSCYSMHDLWYPQLRWLLPIYVFSHFPLSSRLFLFLNPDICQNNEELQRYMRGPTSVCPHPWV